VGSYSFIATDFHRLLLAGLPAHAQRSNPVLLLQRVHVLQRQDWIASPSARNDGAYDEIDNNRASLIKVPGQGKERPARMSRPRAGDFGQVTKVIEPD
jgi:hypothetical protein